MADKPQITVIYQDGKPTLPKAGTVILELIIFLAIGGIIAWWIR